MPRQGCQSDRDRVVLTSGTSEGIDLALSGAGWTRATSVLVPVPTYPLYTATLTKLGARKCAYRTDPHNGWLPDLDHIKTADRAPATRALVVIDPEQPDRCRLLDRDPARARSSLATTHGLVILADEVYADLAYDGPVPPLGSLDPDAPVISFSSISKSLSGARLARRLARRQRRRRLDAVLGAIAELADGRLCSTGPMQYAILAALTGNDDHKATFVHALRERAEVTTRRLNEIEGISCVPPRAHSTRWPKVELPAGRTDEDYVIGLLRATGPVVCVWLWIRHRTGRRIPSYRLPGGTNPSSRRFSTRSRPSLSAFERAASIPAGFRPRRNPPSTKLRQDLARART